jgi:hypothetical protein
MSQKSAPKHLFVEYMYGFVFHYTDQPLFPATPAYTLLKVIDSDDKKWEAIYKNIDGDEARFYSDGISIKMKKATT